MTGKKFRIQKVLLQLLATVIGVLFLFPILMIVNFAFKTKKELYLANPLSLPAEPTIDSFINAVSKLHLDMAFLNSLFYTAASVLIMALLCTMTAWAIARRKNKFFQFAPVYFVIGILVSSQALMLPIYQIWNSLGMVNSRIGIILLYVSTGMSFRIFLQANFMSTIPVELEEAARIDGCGVYRTFFSIVLPLGKASMATLIIVQSFTIWNDFLLTA